MGKVDWVRVRFDAPPKRPRLQGASGELLVRQREALEVMLDRLLEEGWEVSQLSIRSGSGESWVVDPDGTPLCGAVLEADPDAHKITVVSYMPERWT